MNTAIAKTVAAVYIYIYIEQLQRVCYWLLGQQDRNNINMLVHNTANETYSI